MDRMIEFYSENNFKLRHEEEIRIWLTDVIEKEDYQSGELVYVFCDDTYLLKLNKEFLQHDTLTDIITFDNNLGKQVQGEIYISTERVEENAKIFEVTFLEELSRVLVHGVLHLCGYSDKTDKEKEQMRAKEDYYLKHNSFLSS